MPYVLDASATLAWVFRDEATPGTQKLFEEAGAGEQFVVPAHWPTEVLAGLTRAVRRNRLDDTRLDGFLSQLQQFRIAVDISSVQRRWDEVLPLVRTYQLSPYDAAYLALAKRLHLPLATLDQRLRTVALLEDVAVPL